MDKQILYLSYDGMTDPLGQSQVLPYLKGLSQKGGYRFTILSFEKKERFQREGPLVKALMEEAGIDWVPVFFTSNPPVLSKIYDRWNMRRTALRLMKSKRFDMLHCRSYIAAELGLRFKKQFGSRFLFDMRGFWADEKKDNGHWDQHKRFFRMVYAHYKRLEKAFLQEADGVVSLTQAAADEMHTWPGFSQLAMDVIPCCADLDHFDFHKVSSEQYSALRKSLGIAPGNKVMTYLGSIGGWYMTAEMFAFFRQLLDQDPNYTLLLLTKEQFEKVRAEALAAGIPEEKIIVTYAPRQDLPVYLSVSDCSIFFIRPSYSKIASSPTKHAELMGMGIPVICNAIGDTGNIIRQTKTGYEIREFSPSAYGAAIAAMPEILSIPQQQIRDAAFQYFDLAMGIERYSRLYQRIFEKGHQ